MFNAELYKKELEAFNRIKPGHIVSWFNQKIGQSSSEITCISCGATGTVSLFGGPVGMLFVSECEEIRNTPELLALTH